MNGNVANGSDSSRLASTLNVLAGIWLIISSWVLGFSDMQVPFWDTLIVGIVVLVLAAMRLGTPGTAGLSWLNFLVGIWLIISPWVLGFAPNSAVMGSSTAASNAVILGILVGIFGLWAALTSRTPAAMPRV